MSQQPAQSPPQNASSMASNSESMTSSASKLKRTSGDIGWEFGMLCNAMNQDKWKCIKCGKEFSGGVYRIKQHIAGVRGNIAPCLKASSEDKQRCKEALDGAKKKKQVTKESNESVRSEVEVHELEEIEEMEGGGTKKHPRTLGSMDGYVSKINLDDSSLSESKRRRQQSIHDALFKQRSLQVHQYLARWVYESGIPFHAVDNDSFKRFVEAVGQFGPGYYPPSQYQLREPLLKGEVERIKMLLKTQEEEYEKNGCSIMTDAWSDRNRRSIMNLCVNTRSGTSFLSSKEASLDAHTGEYIFEYVNECIKTVGENNVMQVVTDNASNNMAAANMLFIERPQIFWTSCATHTFNLMLEAIGKLPLFKNPITKAKNFTVFVYSHHKTLALMRKRTRKNIIRPGVTRFATAFLTLQSLLEKKEELRQMVSSKEWDDTKWSKSKKGKAAYATIVQPAFWNGVVMCLKVFTPLVKVLRLVDGDVKPAMGFVYGEVKKAKEQIKEALKHKEERYKPILDIVDAKGKGRIDSPLHLTAYLLNPYYYYNFGSTWSTDESENVMDGVFACIERLYPDLDMQDKVINVELVKYKNREGTFGKALAAKGCEKNDEVYDPGMIISLF